VCREGNDFQRGLFKFELFGGLKPIQLGHREVHHHNVREELPGLAKGFLAGGGLAHDAHVGLGVDQQAQAIADDFMIISQQNAQFLFLHDEGFWNRVEKLRPPAAEQRPSRRRRGPIRW